jgi:hypothetical protein
MFYTFFTGLNLFFRNIIFKIIRDDFSDIVYNVINAVCADLLFTVVISEQNNSPYIVI